MTIVASCRGESPKPRSGAALHRRARRRRASLRRAGPTERRRRRRRTRPGRPMRLWDAACPPPHRRHITPPRGAPRDAPPALWGAASAAAQCPAAAGQAPSDVGLAPPPEAVDAAGEESGPEVEDELSANRRGRRAATQCRRRSSSKKRPRRVAQAGAAPRARDAEGREEDLTRHLPPRRIAELSAEQKAELREVVRRASRQQHFLDNRHEWQRQARAASGAQPWVIEERCGEDEHEQAMLDYLAEYVDPVPSLEDIVQGIPHFNDDPCYAGKRWDVVRALASKKVHYRGRLQEALGWDGCHYRGRGGAASRPPFCEAYPNAVLDDGRSALTLVAFEATLKFAGIPNEDEYVKHLLNKHDGEVRHWGAPSWLQVDPDFVNVLRGRQFWHYQFTRSHEARAWLYSYSTTCHHLTWDQIDCVLRAEGCEETTLLKRVSAASGGSASASGERQWQWYIRAGHQITLAEMFDIGCALCSCHFLYNLYLKQVVFA